jgi:hypothetical protein
MTRCFDEIVWRIEKHRFLFFALSALRLDDVAKPRKQEGMEWCGGATAGSGKIGSADSPVAGSSPAMTVVWGCPSAWAQRSKPLK